MNPQNTIQDVGHKVTLREIWQAVEIATYAQSRAFTYGRTVEQTDASTRHSTNLAVDDLTRHQARSITGSETVRAAQDLTAAVVSDQVVSMINEATRQALETMDFFG